MSTDILGQIPLFAELSLDERADLASTFKQVSFPANQPIFWIGDEGDDFFIVERGRVTLTCPDETGKEMILAEIGPGQFFGELSLLDGGRRTATARAGGESSLLSLGRREFQQFLLKHPSATVHIVSVLGRRQREMVEKLRTVSNVNQVFSKEHTSAWNRIADSIAMMSASQGFVVGHAVVIVGWIAYNLTRGPNGIDPYPFALLTMMASMESIFLSIFVLISQNRQTEKDRVSADLDYQVNVKAHLEVMQLHEKLDKLRELVEKQHEEAGSVP